MRSNRANLSRVAAAAFTLVEILIVVVILGILAAVAVPQFSRATQDAARTQTFDELQRIRRAVMMYYARNNSRYPNITAGDGRSGAWGPLVGPNSGYLRDAPINNYVGGPNSTLITLGTSADSSFLSTHGWIFDPSTGDVWAAGFDGNDDAFPAP